MTSFENVKYLDIMRDANRIFMTDLKDLITRITNSLIQDAKTIYLNMRTFEKDFYGLVGPEEFSYQMSVFQGALLKLATALEEKEVEEEFAEMIINRYTNDEKKVLRKFEKFSKLDPMVTPPERLANIIVSETGEIYHLIKEAVFETYVNFGALIKTWENESKIRDDISKAFQIRYSERFSNVVNAIKILLDSQPAWLRRVFKEYEDALLGSYEIRKKFELDNQQLFMIEAEELKVVMDNMENEISTLFQNLEDLRHNCDSGDFEKKSLEDKLFGLKTECDRFKERHNDLLKKWDEKIHELSLLKHNIEKKESELQGLAENEKKGSASREALEAEIFRLKALILDFKNRNEKYQLLKNKINHEFDTLNDKIKIFKKQLIGVREGHFISGEDACMLERIFIQKFESKMRNLPKVFPTPWDSENVSGWGKEGHIQMFEEFTDEKLIPLNRKSIFRVKKRSLLGFGEEKHLIIEGVFRAHTGTLEKRGFDDWPLTLGEFLTILQIEESLSNVEGSCFHVIGISSPTGWDKRVIDYIAGEKFSKRYVLRDFLIVLVNQVTGEIYYSKTHPLGHWYSQLYSSEVDYEKEARIRDWIKKFYEEAVTRTPAFPHVLLSEVTRFTKADLESCLRVLNRLESDGLGKLERGTGGETVFHYLKNL